MKIHFVVGKKDSDIAYWMESLENGLFSGCVITILKAELKKKIAIVPVPTEKGRISRKIDTSIYVSDENVLEMLSQIPQGKRSRFIRSVIRKHLSANYKKGSQIVQSTEKKEEQLNDVKPVQTAGAAACEEKYITTPDESKTKPVEPEKTDEPISDFKAKMMRMANR